METQTELLNFISSIVDEIIAFEQFINEETFTQLCYIKFKSDKEYIHLYNLLEETDYTIVSLKKYKNFWVVIMGYELFYYDDSMMPKKENKIKTKIKEFISNFKK